MSYKPINIGTFHLFLSPRITKSKAFAPVFFICIAFSSILIVASPIKNKAGYALLLLILGDKNK